MLKFVVMAKDGIFFKKGDVGRVIDINASGYDYLVDINGKRAFLNEYEVTIYRGHCDTCKHNQHGMCAVDHNTLHGEQFFRPLPTIKTCGVWQQRIIRKGKPHLKPVYSTAIDTHSYGDFVGIYPGVTSAIYLGDGNFLTNGGQSNE